MQRSISASVKSALRSYPANAPVLSREQKGVRERKPRSSWIEPPTSFPELKGYLRKRATNKRWQKRYFEANDHYLTYYKSSKAERLLACVDLRQVTEIGLGNTTDDVDPGEFFIELAGRIYVMKAGSDAESRRWVEGLRLRSKDCHNNNNNAQQQTEITMPSAGDADTSTDAEAAKTERVGMALEMILDGDASTCCGSERSTPVAPNPSQSNNIEKGICSHFDESVATAATPTSTGTNHVVTGADAGTAAADADAAARRDQTQTPRDECHCQGNRLSMAVEMPKPLDDELRRTKGAARSCPVFRFRGVRAKSSGVVGGGQSSVPDGDNDAHTLKASSCGGCFTWLIRCAK
jgi:hypothetical protein